MAAAGGGGGMPITASKVLSLASLGVSGKAINVKTTSMSSHKAILIREDNGGKGQLTTVDPTEQRIKSKHALEGDAACQSPNGKLMAARGKGVVQIRNLEIGKKIKSTRAFASDKISYWRWLNDTTLAIVAGKSIFHWSSEGGSEPEKMFDRSKALSGAQVINYDSSADGKWLVASGMAKIDGAVQGVMQLYSVEHGKSQKPITSAAGCFTKFAVPGRATPAMLFCYVEQPAGGKPTLRIVEVGYKGADAHKVPEQTLPLPAGSAGDMAVVLQASDEQGILYIFTRMGLCFVYDLETGSVIFRTKIAETPIFTACSHPETGGVLAVAMTSGDLHHVQINRETLVTYAIQTLKNQSLALKLASRLGLSGGDEAYRGQMSALLGANNIEGAADLAASSPGDVLRNADTIRRIQGMPDGARQLLVYLTRIAKKGQLNAVESIELARPALAQNRLPLIQKWVREGKMTSSAELGDLIAPHDSALAQTVYQNSGGAHDKVVGCFVDAGDVEKIIPYAKENAYQPDWAALLQRLVHTHPEKSSEFAQTLAKNSPGPLIQIDTAVDIFMQFKRLPECTSFLYEVLSEDRKEQGYLQTRLLEMNMLGGAAPVADAILGSQTFHHFDQKHIATLAERCGLYHRALELHDDVEDMKRVIPNVARDPKHRPFLIKFFSTLTSDDALACVTALLETKQVDEAVVEIAKQYSDFMGPDKLIKMFEDRKSTNALYFYLAGIVNTSESPEVHFKYIQVAAELNQPDEVVRVCRDSNVYNPEDVKDYLIQKKLPNPQPLIWVCDRHGFVPELTHYLQTNKLQRFLEVYVLKVSPKSCPQVIGKLLDLDADEKFIMNLIGQVPTGPVPQHLPEGAPEPNVCDIGELVQEVEKRNRLKMLERFLEAKIAGGNNEPATHNAMGKIVIMANKDPKDFLSKNTFYDPKILGKFAERLDPQLAFLAYKRGQCDDELLEVSDKNGLFKQQARYLVERRDEELWARVLKEDNPHRQDLIDQVVGTALPEIKDGELVSVTVKAFIDADVPQQLIGLLEKLVLHGTEFSHHTKLQNLLLATAIRCSHSDESGGRFMEYINRLDNFDPERIATMALREDYELYEEAFTIYKKFDMPIKAIGVLIERIHDLERAFGYAERVDTAEVWTILGNAQLADKMVKEAVDSFVKADDASNFSEVIGVSRGEGAYEDLVRYLQMARKSKKEREVDSELAYAFAQCKRLSDLEVFVSEPNVADIQGIGDRCYSEGLFDAGRILFAAIDNNAQLAACYVQLGQYNEAVQAAKKANSSKTWKELNRACMAAGEFRLAQQCGLNIMTDPDHLEELVHTYEQGGHFEELIKLLETGIGAEGAHQGIFTELGVVYSRHLPDKLMNHLKVFKSRLNVPKILRACEAGRHWPEAAFLHVETDDFDNGVKVMIDHSPTAFDHDRFKEIVRKVRNPELYYQAVEFYLREEPMQLNDLLKVLAPLLDHSRVVHILRKDQFHLRLALPYLVQVQSNDITAVNEAVNAVLVKLEDYQRLRTSIDEHQSFDQLDLAKKLESHELVEFQRIAAVLYRRNRRFESAIELSKRSGMFRDAIEAAAASKDVKLVEALVRYFVEEKGDAECFSACLYACYGLVRPDVALELAWRYRLIDYVMPYIVQYLGDQDAKIRELDARTKEKEEEEEQAMGQGMAGGVPMLGGAVPQLANFAANSQPGYPQAGGYPQGGGYPSQAGGYGGMPGGAPGMGGMPGGQFGGM